MKFAIAGRIAAPLALVVLVTLTGCEDAAESGATGFSVDTLASGRVVVRNADVDGPPRWRLEERLRIGRADGEGPDLFGSIGGVELGPEGEIYVLDGQAAEVRVFGPDGGFVRSFGGQGEGPGELANPTGLVLAPDGTLWVMNWSNARYTSWDPGTGEVSREPRRQVSFASFPWPGDFVSGRLLDLGIGADGERVILRLDTAFAPADTLPLPEPDDASRISYRADGRLVAARTVPFAPQPTWAPRPEGGVLMANGAEYAIHRVDFGGDTTLTFRLDRAPIPVTDEEAAEALASFEELGSSLQGAVPDREPSIPEFRPAHGVIFVDDVDRTWVTAMSAEDGVLWDLFDPEGRLLGQVRGDGPIGWTRPEIRGDRVAYSTQIDGIPTVIVYELVEAPAAPIDP